MLADSFLKVAGWLNQLDVSNCLVGGLAIGAHGIPRGTGNVDFLVSKTGMELGIDKLTALVASNGGEVKYKKATIEDRFGDLRILLIPGWPHASRSPPSA